MPVGIIWRGVAEAVHQVVDGYPAPHAFLFTANDSDVLAAWSRVGRFADPEWIVFAQCIACSGQDGRLIFLGK
jgi:hypothetical protein